MASLQRALDAMGRVLVLQVVKRPSSVDETLLVAVEELEAIQRLQRERA